MKLLTFLFSIALSASAFAAEENLDLICSSPNTSAVVILKMELRKDAESVLGRYLFQADSDKPNRLKGFESIKDADGAYGVANSVSEDNSGYAITIQNQDNTWIANLTLQPSGVQFALPCY